MRLEWIKSVRTLQRELTPEFSLDSPQGFYENADELEENGPIAKEPLGVSLVRTSQRPSLFDYQLDLVERVLTDLDGHALLALPTGAGKTRTAVAAVLAGIGSGKLTHVAWLAPSIELVEQAAATFRSLWLMQGNVEQLHLTDNIDESPGEPVVVLTTPQSVYARRRTLHRGGQSTNWDLLVFDEAHQLGARTFRDAVESMGVVSAGTQSLSLGAHMLGLSATPGRADPTETEDLVDLFDGQLLRSRLLDPNPVKVLQRRGVLSELRFRQLTASQVPNEDEARRIRIAARACVELINRKRKPLVFTGSVPGAIVLAQALRSRNIRAEAVHSETSASRRQDIVRQFGSGEVDVLVNQRLLATGYDCPAVSDVLILSRISSPILFEQMVGRAARGPKTGGSRIATIWDYDNHLDLHGRPRSYYRYRDYDWR